MGPGPRVGVRADRTQKACHGVSKSRIAKCANFGAARTQNAYGGSHSIAKCNADGGRASVRIVPGASEPCRGMSDWPGFDSGLTKFSQRVRPALRAGPRGAHPGRVPILRLGRDLRTRDDSRRRSRAVARFGPLIPPQPPGARRRRSLVAHGQSTVGGCGVGARLGYGAAVARDSARGSALLLVSTRCRPDLTRPLMIRRAEHRVVGRSAS